MAKTVEKHQCSERVYTGARWDFGGHACGYRGVLQSEDGKWWCKKHHPDTVAARQQAKIAERDADRQSRKAEVAAADALSGKLSALLGVSVRWVSSEFDTGLPRAPSIIGFTVADTAKAIEAIERLIADD